MNKLNNKLWNMADSMRHKSSMEPSEFKNYILGLMFFKFVSDKNEKFYIDKLKNEISLRDAFDDKKYREALIRQSTEKIGYAFEYDGLFTTLLWKIKEGNYSNELLESSIRFFNDNIASQEDFSNLFSDLRLNDVRLGQTQTDKNYVIASIMSELQDIEADEGVFNSDVLGDAYEYLISQFASNAGKKAGEFYTPQSVSKLLSKIVTSEGREIKDIYDPTCGSGSLLIRVANEIRKSGKDFGSINGQEKVSTTFNLARMNMIIHGIPFNDFTIAQGDTILKSSEQLLKKRYDAIVSNPPYGVKWDSPKSLLADDRFNKYGVIAPKAAMEMSFVQHIESLMSDNGVATILLPVGVLFRSGAENKILKYLIENNILDSAILLPGNMFTSTSIQVVCLVLKKTKSPEGVYLVDATDKYISKNKKNILTDEYIDELVGLYKNKNETKISKQISLDEISSNAFNLNLTRYIQRIDDEIIDMVELKKKIKKNISELKTLEDKILKLV